MELTEEQILKRLDEEIKGRRGLSGTYSPYTAGLIDARELVKQSIAEAQKAPQEPPSQSGQPSNS